MKDRKERIQVSQDNVRALKRARLDALLFKGAPTGSTTLTSATENPKLPIGLGE
ncbi:MAG TPA: hypothetical protein VN851_15500 [Thermoanaerobaculia bacterium]|nr:hypothetical protein [Thermoanaerobaculia bacterium]